MDNKNTEIFNTEFLNLFLKNYSFYENNTGYTVGIERESLRCTHDGNLALTAHPTVFGSKIDNTYFTVDFSESQPELITPNFQNERQCYDFLENLTDIMLCEICNFGELLWPQSVPCLLPENEEDIPIAVYENKGKDFEKYRQKLSHKYPKKMQLLSGIHFNFSFDKELFKKLCTDKNNLKEFKDNIYLKIARAYTKLNWLIVYLFGCSPVICPFDPDVKAKISYRNSSRGYKNSSQNYIKYDSVKILSDSIKEAIKRENLISEKEIYTSVRPKSLGAGTYFENLENTGINHIEIRAIDINTFDKCGISELDMEFLSCFMFYCLMKNDEHLFNIDSSFIAENGLDDRNREIALNILQEVLELNNILGLNKNNAVTSMIEKINNFENTYSYKLDNMVNCETYINTILSFAKKYSADAFSNRYKLKGLEKMELSTQILIRSALTKGLKIEILDMEDNIVRISNKNKSEYVKQATKTNLDTYAVPLIMNNKSVSKIILNENNIPVPKGDTIEACVEYDYILEKYVGKPAVIKPKSTNFGLGITIFDRPADLNDLKKGVEIAKNYGDNILIEEFINGLEYRFLVIDNKVDAVLHRRAANVTGDGKSTLTQLIAIKNSDPLRAGNHTTPLEPIILDEQSILYIKNQGISPDDIISKDKIVYLRANSNISTGGDSIDYTDAMPEFFKNIAVNAAKSFNAVFCGVDIIIEDYLDVNSKYSIIEVNFNPMISMHAFPYKGKERAIGDSILRALKLIP